MTNFSVWIIRYFNAKILSAFMLIAAILLIIGTVVWTKGRTIEKIHRGAKTHLNSYNNYLSDKVKNYFTYPIILSGNPYVISYLNNPGEQNTMSEYLLRFNDNIGAAVSYLLDKKGTAIASSNYKTPQSFVGKNYTFRGYFQNAINGAPFEDINIGIVTKKLGVFRSHPVLNGDEIIGVAVIKYDIDLFTPKNTEKEEILLVADDNEVVFHTNDARYLYHTLHKLPEDILKRMKDAKVYLDEPLLPLPVIKESEINGIKIVTIRSPALTEKTYKDTEYMYVGKQNKKSNWNVHLLVGIEEVKHETYKNIISILLSMILIYSIGLFTIFRIKKGHELYKYQNHLEEIVEERTDALTQLNEQLREEINSRQLVITELEKAYEDLNQSQAHLIQSEKMASLGQVVAGVAHEINTPVGIAYTLSSSIIKETETIESAFNDKSLNRTQLESYLSDVGKGSQLIFNNLQRTAELIKSFKMVSTDQLTQERRSFMLDQYLEEIMFNLQPKLKHYQHNVEISCPKGINVDSYPGAFAQIITNLLLNSLLHAYDPEDKGTIAIKAIAKNDEIIVEYKDDGKGISQGDIKRIFDPFFTTRRGDGGTGLGLHIVYNIITQTLGGRIECKSTAGEGTTFIINFPIIAEVAI
ncbi:multi-sensor signal transduction multi-kinase [Candidatus Magnetominusculus xianensis]|uniref:histidine kinase n=2 Tax=Candidatus Magnetominusculus xianensis TaxID=1748249 RepID=A0ABR5SEE8_9BACT|nr:multi-sensor signal transduction multi-kinase [Candidatus Magnetominusculus xianensis]MBF0402448.1 hypothetical protein [Nitrospirota bacterium]